MSLIKSIDEGWVYWIKVGMNISWGFVICENLKDCRKEWNLFNETWEKSLMLVISGKVSILESVIRNKRSWAEKEINLYKINLSDKTDGGNYFIILEIRIWKSGKKFCLK
jgi:hypothetical protein